MSRWSIALALVLGLGLVSFVSAADAAKEVPAVLQFEMQSLAGKPLKLAEYAGKVILVVNVASECGYTGQYEGLQALYAKYKDQGLVVLGVPCNQFGGQEPGSAAEIAKFCTDKYHVTFPMTAKVEVNGQGQCALYRHLTSKESNPVSPGPIKWNFEKFLIGRDGSIVARYGSGAAPDSPKLVAAVEAELAKK